MPDDGDEEGRSLAWATSARGAALAVLTLLTIGQGAAALDLQGHRGARALAPENTLPAFATALAYGVDTLELDLVVTKDGELVVSHDRRLNPDLARDGSGRYVPDPGPLIATMTLDAVKGYDVGRIRPGSRYADAFPHQKAVDGTRIPTLAEVIALVRKSGNQQVRLNIETKISPTRPEETVGPEVFADLLLDALRQEGFTGRVTIQSFDWRTLQRVQQKDPSIPTAYLTVTEGRFATVRPGEASKWTGGIDLRDYGSLPQAIKAAGGRIWSPHYREIDARDVAEAHQLGLQVIVWTVNDQAEMARMIDLGVDGIISDRPDLLVQVARERGFPVPAPTPVQP